MLGLVETEDRKRQNGKIEAYCLVGEGRFGRWRWWRGLGLSDGCGLGWRRGWLALLKLSTLTLLLRLLGYDVVLPRLFLLAQASLLGCGDRGVGVRRVIRFGGWRGGGCRRAGRTWLTWLTRESLTRIGLSIGLAGKRLLWRPAWVGRRCAGLTAGAGRGRGTGGREARERSGSEVARTSRRPTRRRSVWHWTAWAGHRTAEGRTRRRHAGTGLEDARARGRSESRSRYGAWAWRVGRGAGAGAGAGKARASLWRKMQARVRRAAWARRLRGITRTRPRTGTRHGSWGV